LAGSPTLLAVLSIGEKSQIRALDRAQPGLLLTLGRRRPVFRAGNGLAKLGFARLAPRHHFENELDCGPALGLAGLSPPDLQPSHGPVCLLVGSARLYGLDRQSAWRTRSRLCSLPTPHSQLPSSGTKCFQTCIRHYYLLLRFWSGVFGQSDVVARLLSAICGILTVAVAAGVKPLPGPGRIAFMVLLAVSPGGIEYAQEARSYSLLLLLSAVVTGACLDFVGNQFDDRAAIRAIVALALSGIFASYTHYFGFLLAVSAGAVAVWAGGSLRRV
jgi:hypothetical protein